MENWRPIGKKIIKLVWLTMMEFLGAFLQGREIPTPIVHSTLDYFQAPVTYEQPYPQFCDF